MSRLLAGGIILLTAGLAISPLLIKEKESRGMNYRADPILFYSIFIWAVYVALLVSQWRFGQTGRRFAYGVVGSFVFLLLTFWGFMLLSPLHNP